MHSNTVMNKRMLFCESRVNKHIIEMRVSFINAHKHTKWHISSNFFK